MRLFFVGFIDWEENVIDTCDIFPQCSVDFSICLWVKIHFLTFWELCKYFIHGIMIT